MKLFPFFIFCLVLSFAAHAQEVERTEKISLGGEIVTAMITDDGDTLLFADIEDIYISSPRTFKNRQEEFLYNRYRRYAAIVYPYAAEGIRIFREVEDATENMSSRKRRRTIKRLQKELKKEFKKPLKNLTKTQGRILVKMIERELDRPFYDLLKDLRGGITATYWQTLGRMYGYNLKEGYIVGDDPILDIVLLDFNISKRMDAKWRVD